MKKRLLHFSLILIAYFSCKSELEIEQQRKKSTVATLIEHDINQMHGGSYDLYKYSVDGHSYNITAKVDYTAVIGEKYLIEYDSLYPSRRHLLRENPVFVKGEETNKTFGIVDWANKKDELFSFQYKVKIRTRRKGIYENCSFGCRSPC